MKHCILAKWAGNVTNKAALLSPIRALMYPASTIPGVHGVTVHPCCIDRANRYDLMIVLDMDKDALPSWDASDIHHRWKDEYGGLLEKKAIFDYE